MIGLRIHGFAAASSAGDQPGALADRIMAQAGARHPGVPVAGLGAGPLPDASGHAFVDFDVRARLGRKGTSFYDRVTGLAVVTCGDALDDASEVIERIDRSRIGVVLGTTLGSFKSTSDYTRETLVQDKPYLVNPVLFPNTVMNCAAGQAAIRFGLKGVNATITGGPLAFFNALRYAANAIGRGYADAMLVGAVEEFTEHRAWMSALHPDSDGVPAADGAAVFVMTRAEDAAGAGADIRAVATGYGPAGSAEQALRACVTRVLRTAGVRADEVTQLVTTEVGAAEGNESEPAQHALGHRPEELVVSRSFGDCGAATAALGLAAVLDRQRARPDSRGGLALFTARGADGAVGAALVRQVQPWPR